MHRAISLLISWRTPVHEASERGIKCSKSVSSGEEPAAHVPPSLAAKEAPKENIPDQKPPITETQRKRINIFWKTQCHIYSTFCNLLNPLLQ